MLLKAGLFQDSNLYKEEKKKNNAQTLTHTQTHTKTD